MLLGPEQVQSVPSKSDAISAAIRNVNVTAWMGRDEVKSRCRTCDVRLGKDRGSIFVSVPFRFHYAIPLVLVPVLKISPSDSSGCDLATGISFTLLHSDKIDVSLMLRHP